MPESMPLLELKGRRILVVEDEYVLAEHLRRELVKHEVEVVGPARSVADALELIQAEGTLDGAILDVRLDGKLVYPVADVLRELGVPMVFTTGYDPSELPEAYAGVPCCEKPVKIHQLAQALFGTAGPSIPNG